MIGLDANHLFMGLDGGFGSIHLRLEDPHVVKRIDVFRIQPYGLAVRIDSSVEPVLFAKGYGQVVVGGLESGRTRITSIWLSTAFV